MYIQEIKNFFEQHTIISIIWILSLSIMLYTIINRWIFKSSEVSPQQAIHLINKKNAIIIDIRNANEYLSGYITNSINMSIEKIKNNGIFELKKFKKNPIIIVHNSNILSHSIKKNLKKLQCEEVYVLSGGISSWQTDNLPLLKKINQHQRNKN